MRKMMRKIFGVMALSGARAKNALCIRMNDKGVGAPSIKDP